RPAEGDHRLHRSARQFHGPRVRGAGSAGRGPAERRHRIQLAVARGLRERLVAARGRRLDRSALRPARAAHHFRPHPPDGAVRPLALLPGVLPAPRARRVPRLRLQRVRLPGAGSREGAAPLHHPLPRLYELTMPEPKPTLEEWRALYTAAVAFRDLAPWRWTSEDDLFGVEDTES